MTEFNHISDEDLDLFELGALPAQEAAAIRAQLAASPELQARMLARTADNALLGFVLKQEAPSADARDNFLRAMRHHQPAQPIATRLEPAQPHRAVPMFALWALASLASVLLVVTGVLMIQNLSYRQTNATQASVLQQQEQLLQKMQTQVAIAQQATAVLSTLNAADTSRFVLTSAAAPPQPQIKTYFRKSTGQVVLIASHLPALPQGKTYELWLIATDGGAPIPAGTFSPDTTGNVTATLTQTAANKVPKVFAVTIENAGGATTPTMPIVFAGSQGM